MIGDHPDAVVTGTARENAAAVVAPGDVLLLGEGDIVATDAEVLEVSALLTDESMLTGEPVSVDKNARSLPGAGTVVVRGRDVATAITVDWSGRSTSMVASLLICKCRRSLTGKVSASHSPWCGVSVRPLLLLEYVPDH